MATSTSADKKKRKKWYSVIATQEFQQMPLGETLALEPQEILGRHLHLNAMTLLNDPKKQAITVDFQVREIKGDIGVASLVKYTLNTSQIKRLVRKTSNKIEQSYAFTTKDGQQCKIKPILFTRNKVNHSTLTSLRKGTEAYLQQQFQQQTLHELFSFIFSNKLQMDLKSVLKKIYPVASCEIRSFYKEPEHLQQQPPATK